MFMLRLLPGGLLVAEPPDSDVGVFHVAADIWRGSWSIRLRPSERCAVIPALSFQSRALGVTQGDAGAAAITV
jgi:hypothetical protein